MPSSVLSPIHRKGWPFVGIFIALTVGLFQLATAAGWAGVVLSLWCAWFFRDPDRITPNRQGLIISPADGIVQLIDTALPPPELEMGGQPRLRIAVFMNVFNVHINRAPSDGAITKLAYHKGRFLNASLDKASELNERNCVRMTTTGGHDIAFVQIAGLVARRIVWWISENDQLKAGERFGLIRFGSRVDVYLPPGTSPLVVVGQTTIAGETVIADMMTTESARSGETR